MRENRICNSALPFRPTAPIFALPLSHLQRNAMLLTDLPNGAHAMVQGVRAASSDIDSQAVHRLGELGFIPGEHLQLLRRGPGGREPLAVLIGETLFALRLIEAQCIEVQAV